MTCLLSRPDLQVLMSLTHPCDPEPLDSRHRAVSYHSDRDFRTRPVILWKMHLWLRVCDDSCLWHAAFNGQFDFI